MWHLNLYSFVLLSVSVLSLLKWELQRAGYNAAQYESRLSFSQGLNMCVGLHIAYLETTQDP